MSWVEVALLGAAAPPLLAVLVVTLEALAALLARGGCPHPASSREPRSVVLVPAHDEEALLGETLAALRRELGSLARVLVVADNCSDATPDVARSAGAAVVERRDPARVGKGYALAHGVAALRADPPEVLIVLDADCQLSPGSISRLARHAAETGRPVQADYLLRSADERPASGLSALAFLIRNRVRPRGLRALGLPCQLTGSGMAMPWSLARSADFGGGDLVEDLLLGVRLALAGAPPISCGESAVWSDLPVSARAARSQRSRWEHGHLVTALRWAPRLLLAGLVRRRAGLLAQGLDLAVPPLSLLLLLLLLQGGLACSTWLGGLSGPLPAALIGAGLALLAMALLGVWARFARGRVPLGLLLATPAYVLGKLPIYAALVARGPERRWRRTERVAPSPGRPSTGRASGPPGPTGGGEAGRDRRRPEAPAARR